MDYAGGNLAFNLGNDPIYNESHLLFLDGLNGRGVYTYLWEWVFDTQWTYGYDPSTGQNDYHWETGYFWENVEVQFTRTPRGFYVGTAPDGSIVNQFRPYALNSYIGSNGVHYEPRLTDPTVFVDSKGNTYEPRGRGVYEAYPSHDLYRPR